MFYSYVMGVGNENEIEALKSSGFLIERFGGHYGVSFPKEKAREWEEFITRFLEPGYWNEYLSDGGAVFLFHLEDGFKRYDVKDYENSEVLALCERLCARRFTSIKDMLKGNPFYHDKMA